MSIDPTTVSTDELRGWLTAGSQLGDDRFHGAAIDLLDFADLLDRRSVRAHIGTEIATDNYGTDHRIAWVNWRDLGADTDLGPLGGAQDRLLRLAVSIAVGAPVQLRDALQGLGDQHARAILAAVARALDIAEDIDITDTPAYRDRKRAHDDMLATILGDRETS